MRKILTTLLLTFLPTRVFAQYLDSLDNNLSRATTQTDYRNLPGATYNAIATYLNAWIIPMLLRAAVALAILFLLYGSFQYFTAYGDENKATSAKKTVTYAIIGLIVAFMAMGIAGLVQQQSTNNLMLNPTEVQVQ